MTKTRNGGFTLVELIVTMAIGTIITLACTTVLLLGLRIYHQSTETATRQNEIRVGLTVMENILAENQITDVSPHQIKNGGGEDDILLSYNEGETTIYTGAGASVLKNVTSCEFSLAGDLVTYKIVIDEIEYSSSVYCRLTAQSTEGQAPLFQSAPTYGAAENQAAKEPDIDTIISSAVSDKSLSYQVRTFLKTLASQVGSKGRILTDEGEGDWYSQWYIGDYAEHPGWSEATPWCACFVSWALEECGGCLNGATPKFANVDSFCAEFVTTDNWKTKDPQPGDVIFFDWIVDSEYNPQHVGVVLTVRDGWVYTIEGNSNGRVAVCRYAQDDPRILGYGILNWT